MCIYVSAFIYYISCCFSTQCRQIQCKISTHNRNGGDFPKFFSCRRASTAHQSQWCVVRKNFFLKQIYCQFRTALKVTNKRNEWSAWIQNQVQHNNLCRKTTIDREEVYKGVHVPIKLLYENFPLCIYTVQPRKVILKHKVVHET